MEPTPVENESRQPAGRLVDATSGHAIVELDDEGTIAGWPEPATELYGYDPAAARGRHLRTLFDEPADLDRPVTVLLAQANYQEVTVEAPHRRADGTTFWAMLTLSPLGAGDGYVAVSEDTTDSRQYRETLEHKNDRLKEFTDILVHDLRNPLQVIDQRLELYRETRDETHLESLEETTARMERLVDDLLRVARQGAVVTDREPTDLEDVVRTAWESVATVAGDETLAYESVPTLRADPDRLVELFENLFRNAVEHGGTALTVRVGPFGDGFFVEDDGQGIPPDVRESVFDHGFSTADGGTGYGLSVVRSIANAHGWDVVATEGRAGGARFEFTGVDL